MILPRVVVLAGAGLLAACTMAPEVPSATPATPLRVTNGAAAFANDEGMAARRVAEAACRSRGQQLQSSIYDRYDAGGWVFVGGCA